MSGIIQQYFNVEIVDRATNPSPVLSTLFFVFF